MSERKVQNREIMRFSCTEEDSLYAICRLREKEEKGQLSKSEERQLFFFLPVPGARGSGTRIPDHSQGSPAD